MHAYVSFFKKNNLFYELLFSPHHENTEFLKITTHKATFCVSQQLTAIKCVDQMPYVNWPLHVFSLCFRKLKHNVVNTESNIPRSLGSFYITSKKDLPICCWMVHATLQQRYIILY